MDNVYPGRIQPIETIELGQFQSSVGFDLRTCTTKGLIEKVGLVARTWEPEGVDFTDNGAAVRRIHQDVSGAIVRVGENDLAFGFAPGGSGHLAAVGVDAWTRGWFVGVMIDASDNADEESGPIDVRGRTIAFLPVDRADPHGFDPEKVLDGFAAGHEFTGNWPRVHITWLYRSDVDTCPADDGSGTEPRYATETLSGDACVAPLSGVIEGSERLVNTLTGRPFRHVRVRVGDIVVDACAPEREGGPDYSPGRIIRGLALATGFFQVEPEERGLTANTSLFAELEFPDEPDIEMGPSMSVVADMAECLGLPVRGIGDVKGLLFGSRLVNPMRAQDEVFYPDDDEEPVATRVCLSREDDDGIGFVMGIPGPYWCAYVNGARIGDRSRLHLAGVDVVVTEDRDSGVLTGGPDAFEEYCEEAFRRAVAHQKPRRWRQRRRTKGAEDAWLAWRRVAKLDDSGMLDVIPDNDLDDGPPPPLAHGTLIPVCAQVQDVRKRPTVLNFAGRWIEAPDAEICRMEVDIDVGGRPATLYLPGRASVVPIGGYIIGWAQVCGLDDCYTEIIAQRCFDRFPDPYGTVRPFGNGYDDVGDAGAVFAQGGPVIDQLSAMQLTSSGPLTAPYVLKKLAEDLGLDGEIDDEYTFHLRSAAGGPSVLPIDEGDRSFLQALVEQTLWNMKEMREEAACSGEDGDGGDEASSEERAVEADSTAQDHAGEVEEPTDGVDGPGGADDDPDPVDAGDGVSGDGTDAWRSWAPHWRYAGEEYRLRRLHRMLTALEPED